MKTEQPNQQEIRNGRPCIFCREYSYSGVHAKACPGSTYDIRTWSVGSYQDKDGN